jgi:hypothetical protein
VPVHLDVGDAVVVDQAAHRRPQPVQPAAAAFTDAFGQFLPCRADIACRVNEFVVTRGGPVAAHVEQRLLGADGAVPRQQVVDVVRARAGKCRRRAACG